MVKRLRRYQAFDGTVFEHEEDAYDHEATLLERCKFCGASAQFGRCEPGESTGGGSAYVLCTSCNFSIDCERSEITGIKLLLGASCWDYVYAEMDAASALVRQRWNFLMHSEPKPKPKSEPPEPQEPQTVEYEYNADELDTDTKDRIWKKER